MWSVITSAISGIVDKGLGIIDKLVPDKDQAAKLKAEFQSEVLKQDYSNIATELEARAKIIAAEAQGASWLQRNWRPILMLTIVSIIANNYIIQPYLSLIFPGAALKLDLPQDLWDLMKLGVGGYIVGRSAEKGITAWKG